MTKLLPLSIAAIASILVGVPGQAGTIRSTTTLSERTCTVRPARNAGFIQSAGQTVRINAPEREACSWTPTTRIQSVIRY